jgi:protein-disulfide isomerase
MNKVAWIIFGAAIVLILGGLVVYSRLSNPGIDVSSVDVNALVSANDQNGQVADHTLGKTDSNVIFIEYGDFQCPSCGGAHPQVKQIMEEYSDRVLFIFRNLPLTSIHPNARAAAAAVEAAGLQGKYWEMHDLVFESQDDWSSLNTTDRTSTFTAYAETLALNKDQFLSDLNGDAVKKKIAYDEALFKSTGFEKSTPAFILNGSRLESEPANALVQGSTTELKALFDKALSE